jgi:hypothetical protein
MRFMTSITAASICLSMTNINTASAEGACVEAAIRSHLVLMEYCVAENETPQDYTGAGGASDWYFPPVPSANPAGNPWENFRICERTAYNIYLAERSAC